MNKTLKAGLVALLATGSIAASAAPVSAHDEQGYGGSYGYHHDNSTGAAIAGGLIGLAIGAALSSSRHGDYRSGSYGNGYYRSYGYGSGSGYGYGGYGTSYGGDGDGGYGSGYGGDYGYRQCVARQTIWDPYYGGYVVRRVRYAC